MCTSCACVRTCVRVCTSRHARAQCLPHLSEKTGSVMKLTPPIWHSTVACPTCSIGRSSGDGAGMCRASHQQRACACAPWCDHPCTQRKPVCPAPHCRHTLRPPLPLPPTHSACTASHGGCATARQSTGWTGKARAHSALLGCVVGPVRVVALGALPPLVLLLAPLASSQPSAPTRGRLLLRSRAHASRSPRLRSSHVPGHGLVNFGPNSFSTSQLWRSWCAGGMAALVAARGRRAARHVAECAREPVGCQRAWVCGQRRACSVVVRTHGRAVALVQQRVAANMHAMHSRRQMLRVAACLPACLMRTASCGVPSGARARGRARPSRLAGCAAACCCYCIGHYYCFEVPNSPRQSTGLLARNPPTEREVAVDLHTNSSARRCWRCRGRGAARGGRRWAPLGRSSASGWWAPTRPRGPMLIAALCVPAGPRPSSEGKPGMRARSTQARRPAARA